MPNGSDAINALGTRARRGFTLAELVVVLAIIAVLSAVAIPRFAQAGNTASAQSAANMLAAAFEDARVAARIRSAGVRSRFSPTTDRVQIGVPSTSEVLADFVTTDAPYRANISMALTEDGDDTVDVDALGFFSQSAMITLFVGNRSVAVLIDADTGTVSTTTSTVTSTKFLTDKGLK